MLIKETNNIHVLKMTYTTKTVVLFLCLVALVKAGIFDKSFLIRLEDITSTNKNLSDSNKECKQTVIDQRNMMADLSRAVENLTATVEVLAAKNDDQGATIKALNTTLSKIQKGKLKSF